MVTSILVDMALSFARSAQLQQRAEGFLPGGVDSPVRAFRAVGGHPPFVERAEGAYLFDADGNRFVDMFGSWGPMLLGHAFPPAVAAIREGLADVKAGQRATVVIAPSRALVVAHTP